MSETAKINIQGKDIELPLVVGTENEVGIDINTLRATTGAVTLDLGYKNTGATTSSITYLDGEKGILRHRGYSIEELADKAEFLEIAYLLIHGELPTKEEYADWDNEIRRHTLVNGDIQNIFDAWPTGSHPMGQLIAMISSLSSFYPESLDPNASEEARMRTITRLLAKMPTICAMISKNRIGHPLIYPQNNLTYVENYLNMTFKHVTEEYELDPILV